MGKKASHANNIFLIGLFTMMILLFVVIFVFLYWSLKENVDQNHSGQEFSESYQISFDASAQGRPIILYVNDSLIFSGTPTSLMTLSFTRFAQESSLLVVDEETDQVSIIELPEETGKILIGKKNGEFLQKD